MTARSIELVCGDRFKIKKATTKTVVIEGWANKAVLDRGREIIFKDAWNLKNFKKAPIILFNHDKNKPIGKATAIKATEDGLWIRAEISKSKDMEISRIRDLVEEGILNAFSVGFNAADEEQDELGNIIIKSAELYEVSIVTLPMNQDSLFELSTKSLNGLNKHEAVVTTLRAKGAMVAAAVQDKLALDASNPEDAKGVIDQIAQQAGVEPQVVADAITGNLTPIPENVLQALSIATEIPLDELRELDQRDVADEAKASTDEPSEDEPPVEDEAKTEEPKEGDEVKADEPKEDESAEEIPEGKEAEEPLDEDEKNIGGTLESKISDEDARGDRDEHLAQMRQTNILLTQLIEHVAGLSSKLSPQPEIPEPIEDEQPKELPQTDEDDEADNAEKALLEKLDRASTFAEKLAARMKALGA